LVLPIGFDLRYRIGQLVVGVVDFFRANMILRRNRNGDEDVVFGPGLHGQSDLIHPQTHRARDGIEKRRFQFNPGSATRRSLPKIA
jgi:hypothetical protein